MKREAVFSISHTTINSLMTKIEDGDLALPDLQRPFVWNNTQVRNLFRSIYKGFPIGLLILWEINHKEGDFRPVGILDSDISPTSLIIDGQQRLTALYSVIKGKEILTKDYKKKFIKIAFNPFDEKFEVQNSSIKKNPKWVNNITEVFQKDIFEFMDEYFEKLEEKMPDISNEEKIRVRNNINSLTNIESHPFSSIKLHPTVDLEEISDIFVKINSEGKKLNTSDFIFTLMSIYWPEGKNKLEQFSREAKTPSTSSTSSYNMINEEPSNENLLRTIISYSFLRGNLKYAYLILKGRNLDNKTTTEGERIKNFEILKEGLEVTLNLVHWHDFISIVQSAGFVNQNLIRAENVFYQTYALYLLGRCKFNIPHIELESIIRKWIVFSILTQRYSGSTESMMERELSHFRDHDDLIGFLTTKMDEHLTNDFWEINLPPALESSQPTTNNAYNVYLACKVYEDNNILFSEIKLKDYLSPLIKSPKKVIEHHHIFPKNYLKTNLNKTRTEYNQAANMIYIDYHKNIEIGDMAPHEYWQMILDKCNPETKEFIENNYVEVYDLPEEFWNMEYEDFLEQRRKLMAKSIHQYFEKL